MSPWWRRWAVRWLLGLLLLCAALASPVQGQAPAERRPMALPPEWQSQLDAAPGYRPGEVLVLYEHGSAPLERSQALAAAGVAPVKDVAPDLQVLAVPAGDELALAERLRTRPGVVEAAPNYRVQALGGPSDPYLSRQWYHPLMRSSEGWASVTGSAAVTIAVIDSGADLSHPDLAARLLPGQDYVDGGQPLDEFGHGTHVAGLIGAVTDNAVGIAAVDWQARLLVIRTLDANGQGYVADIVQAIDYAVAHGADIINLSLGGPKGGAMLQPAIDRAHAAGVVVVAAMGNEGVDTPYYPAACDHVIAVAATTRLDRYASYSNYGAYVDLAAPGGEWGTDRPTADGIYSTMPTYRVTANSLLGMDYDYEYWQGTSMSAALVSGLSALLLSAHPALTPEGVEDTMAGTAVDLGASGWDGDYGWGRIAVGAAVTSVTPTQVRDLSIVRAIPVGNDRVTLDVAWTPPLRASSIEIRRSTAPITADTWESTAVVVQGLPADSAALTVSDLPYAGGTLYLALRADSVHRPGEVWSAVSNNAFWPVRYRHALPIVGVHR
jgi:subtilisin family serine protease